MQIRAHNSLCSIIVNLLCWMSLLISAQRNSSAPSSPKSPSSAPPSTNGGRSMLAYINAIRHKQNLRPATWSPLLAQNAYLTGQATGGRSMHHILHPGTTGGQVLVPGFGEGDVCTRNLKGYTSFELYYTNWLCEVSGDVALEGKCGEILRMSRVDVRGQTGHYRLLSGRNVRAIGCAFFRNPGAAKCGFPTGIWACDLGS